jgi:outer membrane protein assembly factor BamB
VKIAEVLGLKIPTTSTPPPRNPEPPGVPTHAATEATAPGEKPKLRFRGSGGAHVDRPVVLPGLEEVVRNVSPPAKEESIPILQPVDEAPAAAPKTPPPPKPQPRPKLTVGKHQGVVPRQESPRAGKPVVQCPAHPEKQATHNCMNCGKPICIECVHAYGYYCGKACKEAVRAREPRLAKTNEAEKVDEQVGQTMEKLGSLLSKLKTPACVLIAMVVGYFVYMKFWGPRGRITANLPVVSEMAVFDAKVTEPDTVIFQRNDDLCSAKLSTQQELWKTALRPLEEKFELPKRTNYVADSPALAENLGGYSEGGSKEYRDQLRFTHVQGDHIVVHSARQLLVFNARDGSLKWKIFNPESSSTILAVHEGGVLCQISPRYSAARSGEKPRVVNLSFSDGSEKWSLPDTFNYGTQILSWKGKLVWLSTETDAVAAIAKSTTRKTKQSSDEEETDDASAIAVPAPVGKHTLKLVSPADGSMTGQKQLNLPGRPELAKIGDRLCLVAGNQLLLFESGVEPTLTVTLPDQPEALSVMQDDSDEEEGRSYQRVFLLLGGDSMAMKTSKGVVALDAKTGQQKWVRSDVNAESLAVGPDGSVYATVGIPKAEANKGAAQKYRIAAVADGGFNMPDEAVTTLLKLDAKTGKTLWGVKNIGRRVMFAGREMYVVDTLSKVHLFSGSDMFAGHLSVRSISPRNGKDDWTYLAKAQLYRMQLIDRKLFLVVAEESPAGRMNPTCNYQLRILEKK